MVRAAAQPNGFSFPGAAKKMGYDLSEGLFGFTPFSELWVGRLAMAGFAVGLGTEFATGEGILMQLWLMQDGAPNFPLLSVLAILMGGGTLAATANTLVAAQSRSMSAGQVKRYANAFVINDKAVREAALEMKKEGDFTSPDNYADIAAARTQMPVDSVLGMDDAAVAGRAADDMKTSGEGFLSDLSVSDIDEAARELKAVENVDGYASSAWPRVLGDGLQQDAQLTYMKEVEMRNGRWAMLGFAAAVLGEAATGYGILPQLIFYFKTSGLLGAESGF